MSLMTRRYESVVSTMNEVRRLRDSMGPSDPLIVAIAPLLSNLALQEEIFPETTFSVNDGTKSTIYELWTDVDGRLGLYASAGLQGKYQPPHDHRTWSCIAGVRGAEHNCYFERTDDRSIEDRGTLEPRGELTLRAGIANGMMGHLFHSIEVVEQEPSLHLHLYGDPLDRLEGRVYFDSDAGGRIKPFMTYPSLHTALVSAKELREMLEDDEEIAVLDTRELGEWATGHLLEASPAPKSRLELDVSALLPRVGLRVVVIANDNPAGHDAAHLLRRGGYRNVAVLDGGIESCLQEGLAVHDGIGTFEKAFGELVQAKNETPTIKPAGLQSMQANDIDHVLIDCRPTTEFEQFRVHGAKNAPGVELLVAVEDLDLALSTQVVVSCAGRTRSIIGAQTLIDAGVPNSVSCLEGGVMGWRIAGGEVQTGSAPQDVLSPRPLSTTRARELVEPLAESNGIVLIDESALATYLADTNRCTYLFDVRSPDSYRAGHRAGFESAPGGQLIQELTHRVAVPRARIVLLDDDGISAILTAHWVKQMGYEVCVLTAGLEGQHIVTESDFKPLVQPSPSSAVSWHAVETELAGGGVLIDCGSSREYRHGHIPGSRHCTRSKIADGLKGVDVERLLFTCEDGSVAEFAAGDAAAQGWTAAHLIGGNSEWESSGNSLTDADPVFLVEPVDIWVKPYETNTDDTAAMKRYLEWEVGLRRGVDLTDRLAI